MYTKRLPLVSSLVIATFAAALPLSLTNSTRADEPRIRIEVPHVGDHHDDRGDRDHQGDLAWSMDRLRDSINRMNDVLSHFPRSDYGRLRDEVNSFNIQVGTFQNLVDHHETNSVLRDAFSQIEQAAAVIDVHMRSMKADPRVNDAWQTIGLAYHRVSEDIDYRSASER